SWDGSLLLVAFVLFFDFRVAVARGGDDLLARGDDRRWLDAAEQIGEAFNRLLLALALGGRVALDADVAVELHPRARRNQAAHDNVLLESAQVVNATRYGRLRQHARRLLERRRRDERVGRERGLRDAQQKRLGLRRLAVLAHDALVLVCEAEAVNLLVQEEV